MRASPHEVALLVACLGVAACSGSSDPTGDAPASQLASSAAQRIESGRVSRWPETTAHLVFDVTSFPAVAELGPARPSGLDAFWSIATTSGTGSGFFYADTFRAAPETRVAWASSARRVQDVTDARALDYGRDVVGPVPPGGIVVVEDARAGRFLALVLDAIAPTDPRTAGAGPYAYADVTWYLAPPGVADFGAAAPPP